MNIFNNKEKEVTTWKNIKLSCNEIPNLKKEGVVGIHYTQLTDFASAGILMRDGDTRYWITHSWLCAQSLDIPRLKCPYQDWEKQGLLTVVDDVEINPDLIMEWIANKALEYNITKLAIDNFRYTLVSESMKKIGFDYKEHKNIKLVRPSDIVTVSPIIDRCFTKQQFTWGDNPLMRWAVNNTKLVRAGKRNGINTYYYKGIKATRKNEPFMALVAAMTIEKELSKSSNKDR